ncbi:hypothetical protein ACFE04_020939 [Oxalis oulophora]
MGVGFYTQLELDEPMSQIKIKGTTPYYIWSEEEENKSKEGSKPPRRSMFSRIERHLRKKRRIAEAHTFNLFEPNLEFAHQAFQISPLHLHNREERFHNRETYAHSSIRCHLDFGLRPEGTKMLQWKKKEQDAKDDHPEVVDLKQPSLQLMNKMKKLK